MTFDRSKLRELQINLEQAIGQYAQFTDPTKAKAFMTADDFRRLYSVLLLVVDGMFAVEQRIVSNDRYIRDLEKRLHKLEKAAAPAKNSVKDLGGKRSFRIDEFAARNSISRSQTYVEIKEGRLQTRKVGSITLITIEDEEAWLSWSARARR